jgi:hypothetical protein
MITLQVTYQMPEDQDAFQQAHFAPDAWLAIDQALNDIRMFIKHGAGDPAKVLVSVRQTLLEAKGKME